MKIWRLDVVGAGLMLAIGLGLCVAGVMGTIELKAELAEPARLLPDLKDGVSAVRNTDETAKRIRSTWGYTSTLRSWM